MSEPVMEPETAGAFHARIMAAAEDDGRLPVAVEEMPGWDIFPFELDGLRVKPVLPLADTEPARMGETRQPARVPASTTTRSWCGATTGGG